MITDNVIHIYQNYIVGESFKFTFDKNLLNKGIILNKEKFIKTYVTNMKKNNICKVFFNKRLTIIYDELLSINEVNFLISTFETIYYKVSVKSEKSFVNISKKDSYLVYTNILKLYYIDNMNEKKTLSLDIDNLTNSEIKNLINKRIKNNLYLINISELLKEKIIDEKINYYYLDENDKFFLKM